MYSAPSGPDAQLRRIERRALIAFACVLIAAAASGAGVQAVSGVIGGGLLVAVRYRAIRGGVDAAVSASVDGSATTRGSSASWRLVKFITRFAILGAIAYVMMVRLRAQPMWMLLGASSLVAAVALEAMRPPRPRP